MSYIYSLPRFCVAWPQCTYIYIYIYVIVWFGTAGCTLYTGLVMDKAMRDLPRRCVAALQARFSPRRRCERAYMAGQTSLPVGGLFRPMALRESVPPPRGRPCDMNCTCSLVQALRLCRSKARPLPQPAVCQLQPRIPPPPSPHTTFPSPPPSMVPWRDIPPPLPPPPLPTRPSLVPSPARLYPPLPRPEPLFTHMHPSFAPPLPPCLPAQAGRAAMATTTSS